MVKVSSRWSVWLYYALLAMVCLHFALAYTRQVPIDPPFHDYALGKAGDPYQTRLLMSLVFRLALGWKFLATLGHKLPEPYNDPLNLLMLPIVALSLFVATEAVRRAAKGLQVPGSIARWVVFCVPLMMYFNFILISEVRIQTPYDVVQVAVFAICIMAALSRNRLLFYAVFIIGTLNRESTCFLVPIFGLLELNVLPSRTARHYGRLLAELAFQTALWLPLRYFSAHFYEKHPAYAGGIFIKRNFIFLLNPLHWPTIFSVFAFLWVLYLVQFRHIRHRGLQSCAILLPVWIAVMFTMGDLLEIRINSEWISYFGICVILIVSNLLNSSEEAGTSRRLAQRDTIASAS